MRLFFFLTLTITLASSLVPTSSLALELNLNYPEFGNVTLDCDPLPPGKACGQNPNALIAWIYYFIVGISGLAAFVMLVWGGVQWLTSGAIPSQAGEARDKIKNAILGLLLVLASFLIIQIINPELTILQLPGFNKAVGTVPTLPAAPLPPAGGTVSLSAGGEPNLLCIPNSSAATVPLQWTSTNSNCQADSNPATSWTGAQPSSGNTNVNLTTTGTFTFQLVCSNVPDSVQVTVTAGSCSAGTPITVNLKARDSGAPPGSGTSGSITFDTVNPTAPSNQLPSGRIALDWINSAGTASCSSQGGIGGDFNALARPLNGTWTSNPYIGPSVGTYTYTITCLDATGTQSATGSVQLTVL